MVEKHKVLPKIIFNGKLNVSFQFNPFELTIKKTPVSLYKSGGKMFVEHKYLRYCLVLLTFIIVSMACNLPTTPESPPEEVQQAPPVVEVTVAPDINENTLPDEQLPVEEEEPVEEPDICFEDICFSYDESIACNVNGEIVPASDGENVGQLSGICKVFFRLLSPR